MAHEVAPAAQVANVPRHVREARFPADMRERHFVAQYEGPDTVTNYLLNILVCGIFLCLYFTVRAFFVYFPTFLNFHKYRDSELSQVQSLYL
jgi:hypothetical protein